MCCCRFSSPITTLIHLQLPNCIWLDMRLLNWRLFIALHRRTLLLLHDSTFEPNWPCPTNEAAALKTYFNWNRETSQNFHHLSRPSSSSFSFITRKEGKLKVRDRIYLCRASQSFPEKKNFQTRRNASNLNFSLVSALFGLKIKSLMKLSTRYFLFPLETDNLSADLVQHAVRLRYSRCDDITGCLKLQRRRRMILIESFDMLVPFLYSHQPQH